jgi:hypothetical protein
MDIAFPLAILGIINGKIFLLSKKVILSYQDKKFF